MGSFFEFWDLRKCYGQCGYVDDSDKDDILAPKMVLAMA